MTLHDMADEVHQSVIHKQPVVAFCKACGRDYFVAFQTFVQLKGRCSCSWHCCQVAEPGNRPHELHMGVRDATPSDLQRAEAGEVKDFRQEFGRG